MGIKIIKKEENFAEWYTSVCLAAKLFSYGTIKGTINYLPYGWAIWQKIVDSLDKKLKLQGAENIQLPLFIKTSDFTKEKAHIEGFAPEAFLVNKIGNEVLSDPLIVRPTSEVIFSQLFKELVHSYNDLPIKYNQWCSVYRAEKNTKPFLRGCEFFWHELHCLFSTEGEAINFALIIHELYNSFLKNILALPVLSGKKTEGEKFAGAVTTYTREVFSQDGQCIQTGTSHYLGTNFSKIYDIKFQDKNNEIKLPFYTSHGITTRIIGDLVLVHADNKGLVLPFDVAPIQVLIATIFVDKDTNVLVKAKEIKEELESIYDCEIDSRNEGFGYKMMDWEVKGIPFAIVIGPKDLENKTVMLIRRDSGEKIQVAISEIKNTLKQLKVEYYKSLYSKAENHLNSSIVEVSSIEELKDVINQGKIGLAYFGGDESDEKKIKELTTSTPRCIKEENVENQICFFTKKPAINKVYFARAY